MEWDSRLYLKIQLIFLVGVGCAIAFLLLYKQIDFWVFEGSPTNHVGHRVNPLPGFTQVFEQTFLHLENAPSIWISYSLLGGPEYMSMYAARPVYPFMVAAFSPLFGTQAAFVIVNAIGWAAALAATIELARCLGASLSGAFIAGLFSLFAFGYWYHLTDYSAHMLAATMYVVALLALVKLGIAERRLAWRDLVMAAALLSGLALTYNSGLGLIIAFAVFALAMRNRLLPVILVFATCMVFQRLWPYVYAGTIGGGSTLYAVEQEYLGRAIGEWRNIFAGGLPVASSYAVRRIAELIFSDPALPWLIVIAALGALFLRSRLGPIARRNLYFVLLAAAAPFVLVLPWTPAASARGYLIYCSMGPLIAAAACVISKLPLRTQLLITAVICATQLAWLFGALSGSSNPVHAYQFGPRSVTDVVYANTAPRTEILSLTGHEQVPVTVGGTASAYAAGGISPDVDVSWPTQRRSATTLWMTRIFLVIPLLVALWVSRLPKLAALGCIVLLTVVPPLLAEQSLASERFRVQSQVTRPQSGGMTVTQEIDLSASAWEMLQQAVIAGNAVEFMSGLVNRIEEGRHNLRIEACGNVIFSRKAFDMPFVLDNSKLAAIAEPDCVRTIRVALDMADNKKIGQWRGWQRLDLPGRRLTIDSGVRETLWPFFELRIREANNPERAALALFF
jgi:hypothetical protein